METRADLNARPGPSRHVRNHLALRVIGLDKNAAGKRGDLGIWDEMRVQTRSASGGGGPPRGPAATELPISPHDVEHHLEDEALVLRIRHAAKRRQCFD